MTQHVPALIAALQPTIDHYGYLAVGGLVFLEDFGVPVPGETTLIAAAFFSGAGQLNFPLVLLIAFVAAILGDNIGYVIGRTGGHQLAERFGKYVLLTPERLARGEAFSRRHGAKMVVVARFIEGLRQANGIIAGITEMHWKKFVIANALGAALWVGVWGSVGYFGGNHIETIYRFGAWFTLAAAVVIVAIVATRLFRKRRSTK